MYQPKWGFWLLTAFVVGNMVGSGIFMLPASLAQIASPLGVTLAWLATGLGVFAIALVFGNLSMRRPELTAGPQSYARALFRSPRAGNLAGFSVVWGYWVANFVGNVAIITTSAGYLSYFFPVLSDEQVLFTLGGAPIETGKLATFLVCTALLWGIHAILVQGLSTAGTFNFLATAAKILGFALFIAAILAAFQPEQLETYYFPVTDESGAEHGLVDQVNLAAISTLWAFVGIESAAVLSGRARSQRDVKQATLAGLFVAVALYLAITLFTMGVLPLDTLKSSEKPLVDALTAVIGESGATVMALLAIASLLGTSVGWILLSAEVACQGAKSNMFPTGLGRENPQGSPTRALFVTNMLTQALLLSTLSSTIQQVFIQMTTIATLAFLVPYLVSAAYQLKLVWTGETYDRMAGSRLTDGLVAAAAMAYSIWVIKTGTADLKTLLMGLGLFAAGIVLYPLMVPRRGAIDAHNPVTTEKSAS